MNEYVPPLPRSSYIICASVGTGGNHLRWLLLLDKKFSMLGQTTLDAKIEFIANEVYNDKRINLNWLTYEWPWRQKLHRQIQFVHMSDIIGWGNNDVVGFIAEIKRFQFTPRDGDKMIFIGAKEPMIALSHYFKFNPAMNNQPINEFLEVLKHECELKHRIVAQHADNTMFIDVAELATPELNYNLYSTVTKLFGLDDNYEVANQVHKLWYHKNKQLQQTFLAEITDTYNNILAKSPVLFK